LKKKRLFSASQLLPATNAVLEKNALKPWQHEQQCIPTVDADFVAAMEDVLDLYAQPYDPATPLVCFDEKPLVVHG
jgi:hypothetical protein